MEPSAIEKQGEIDQRIEDLIAHIDPDQWWIDDIRRRLRAELSTGRQEFLNYLREVTSDS